MGYVDCITEIHNEAIEKQFCCILSVLLSCRLYTPAQLYIHTLICLIATCCFTIIGVIIAVVAGGTNNFKTSSHRSVTSVGEFVAQLGQLIDANIPLLNHGILGFDRLIHKLQLIAKHLDVLTMLFYFLQLLINRLNKRLPILLIALNLCKKCCHIMYWARHFHHKLFQSRLHTKPRNRTNSDMLPWAIQRSYGPQN